MRASTRRPAGRAGRHGLRPASLRRRHWTNNSLRSGGSRSRNHSVAAGPIPLRTNIQARVHGRPSKARPRLCVLLAAYCYSDTAQASEPCPSTARSERRAPFRHAHEKIKKGKRLGATNSTQVPLPLLRLVLVVLAPSARAAESRCNQPQRQCDPPRCARRYFTVPYIRAHPSMLLRRTATRAEQALWVKQARTHAEHTYK